jgi:hypothetical protein
MFEVRILDAESTVHIAVGHVVYHVEYYSDIEDTYYAVCIETDCRCIGNSRQEVLDKMGALLQIRHAGVHGVTT